MKSQCSTLFLKLLLHLLDLSSLSTQDIMTPLLSKRQVEIHKGKMDGHLKVEYEEGKRRENEKLLEQNMERVSTN